MLLSPVPLEAAEAGIMNEAMTDFQFSPQESEPGDQSGSARDALAEMAEQIRRLDEAAAEAATEVGHAAEGLGHGSGNDVQDELLSDLSSSLVERVNEIRGECERLSKMLARATRLSAREGLSSLSPGSMSGDAVPEIFKPAADAETSSASRLDRRRSPGQSTPEGVRLAATQMAVAGSSRTEIERCLRIQFGVLDASAALDEIFGTRSSEVQ
jgi:hypothetical protein